MSDSNGPNKAQFNDALADYTEIRFQQMKWASKAGACLAAWERKGGARDDIREGFEWGKLTPEERVAEARRKHKIEAFMGITQWEESGQGSFTATFDTPVQEEGAGGAPLGSRLSVARAAVDGYNTAKAGGALADNPWKEIAGGELEAKAWDENFGDGQLDRPPPKERKKKDAGETADADAQPSGMSATEAMARQAQAMDDGGKRRRGRAPKALPAPENTKPGWQGDRDFHQEPAAEETMPGDVPPVVH